MKNYLTKSMAEEIAEENGFVQFDTFHDSDSFTDSYTCKAGENAGQAFRVHSDRKGTVLAIEYTSKDARAFRIEGWPDEEDQPQDKLFIKMPKHGHDITVTLGYLKNFKQQQDGQG